MPIRTTLDEILAKKNMTARSLAEAIGVSETHLSLFRSGKVRGIRFSTLAKMCKVLNCQPGDLVAYVEGDDVEDLSGEL
ncbi:transcriptional regulator, XRE family [Candidatus Koribacter versatilis Ellin345]|uniref:Transcriptional regulator, XRE family n=1 Tax=Koribacter versatilis (strain Ellin345) TaxID=204669 RepID=Q1IRQ8_KORVE|nr:helix-turn-helix transcriptional regulator [Candidatus Koribacter versatilis]ABF40442.1 transcriptional regulator, XRE family [Candidatus Koribacter versatilis Ellin345]